jgi:hypothetical protein
LYRRRFARSFLVYIGQRPKDKNTADEEEEEAEEEEAVCELRSIAAGKLLLHEALSCCCMRP